MQLDIFRTFAEALALGLLIGSERYKGKTGKIQPAGMRTFTIICLLGAACSLIALPGFTMLTFGAIVAFLGLAYYRDPSESYGLTTEMAALLTFWLGFLLKDQEVLAISTGIVVVILLASKKALHEFVREQVSEVEFFDTLKFLAVVFVVLPILPNRYIGPMEFFNPTQIWILIILVSAISYAGYVLMRVLGGKRGLTISALLGGIVSTLAVTVSLAERSRETPELSRVSGVTAVMANAVQFPRLLFLIWIVDIGLMTVLSVPFLAMSLVGFAGAWLFSRTTSAEKAEPIRPLLQNPFSLKPVLKFGLLFISIFFVTRLASTWLGPQGVYIASALAGLGSVSAVALSMADMVGSGTTTYSVAAVAIFLAIVSNAVFKWVLSLVEGTRLFALWVGGGFLAALIVGGILILMSMSVL
jgi:uncharacterized membrane protein (DUF4010 family)